MASTSGRRARSWPWFATLPRNGRTLVLAIHQLIDAERVCDRFVLLADGRIRGVGTLEELRAQTGMAAAGLEDVFLALT